MITSLLSRRAALALAFATLAVLAAPARAGFTVALDSTAASGANTAYNYSASITEDDTIVAGDFFRIYDFFGLVGTPTGPAGWSVSVANLNPTPPPNVILGLGDDPTLANVTFTYNGAATITGPTAIAGFQLISTSAITTFKNFVGRDTNAVNGTDVDSIGAVRVAAVPEPASLAMLGLGGLGLLAKFRRRKAATA